MLFLDGHRYAVRSLAWSPQAKILASGGDDHTVRLWRLLPEKLLFTLQGHGRNVYAVAFSPDGETLLSGGGDHQVRLWSAATGAMRTTPTVHSRSVNALAIHPGGDVATGDGAWRSSSHTFVRRLVIRTRPSRSVSLRGNGPTLAIQGQEVSCLAFSPDGTTLAVGTPWMLFMWTPRREPAQTLRFGALAAGSRPPVEATASGALTLLAEGAWFRSLAFSPEGRYLAAAAGAEVWLWDRSQATEAESAASAPLFRGGLIRAAPTGRTALGGHAGGAHAVAFSPMGGALASAGDDGAVRLWSVADGAQRVSFAWEIGPVYSLAYSPDGLALAAGGQGRIVVWDVEEYY